MFVDWFMGNTSSESKTPSGRGAWTKDAVNGWQHHDYAEDRDALIEENASRGLPTLVAGKPEPHPDPL